MTTRYLTGLAFFAAGLTLGFILATKRIEEARHIQEQLVVTQDRLDAMRNKPPSYRRVPLDYLTAIRGIGKVYQRKLRDAGITTYRQLAEAEPQWLRRSLDLQDRQRANVEALIQQASDRMHQGQ